MPVSSYTICLEPGPWDDHQFQCRDGHIYLHAGPGFVGTDTFKYDVTANGPNSSAAPATSNPATVTITVDQGPPVTLLQKVNITNKQHR